MRGLTIKNRIMVSPMAQYAAVDGCVTDWHFAHFAQFALGGAGLIFMEASKVERRGLGTVGDMGLWKDDHVPGLKRIVELLFPKTQQLPKLIPKTQQQFNCHSRKHNTIRSNHPRLFGVCCDA
jgi:hypothetical protein